MDARQTPADPVNSVPGATELARASGDRYVYRRRLPRLLAASFDRVGPILFPRKKISVRPSTFWRIAVIRADQIGDVVLAVPFLDALRARHPDAQVTFVTSSAGQELLRSARGFCAVRVFNAPWFRGERGTLQAMRDLGILLKTLEPDAIVDLRGDVRHLWAARRALPDAWIEGYGITGGAFLADFVPAYRPGRHAALKNLEFMDVAVPAAQAKEIFAACSVRPDLAALPLTRKVTDTLAVGGSRPRVAFHMGAGADSKRWPELFWRGLAERVSRETSAQIVWIGDRDAEERSRRVVAQLDSRDRERSVVLGEQVGLGSLNTLLEKCRLLVTHDSGPAHVASAVRLPTLVLFSGANSPEEWRPLNPAAVVLNRPVPCAPCGLKTCGQPTHRCMEAIEPDAVFEKILRMLA